MHLMILDMSKPSVATIMTILQWFLTFLFQECSKSTWPRTSSPWLKSSLISSVVKPKCPGMRICSRLILLWSILKPNKSKCSTHLWWKECSSASVDSRIYNQLSHLWWQELLNPMKEIGRSLWRWWTILKLQKMTSQAWVPMIPVDNATFAIHKDMKSHTGATMTLGSGTICSISMKQKVNTQSSTEAKLVGFDDVFCIKDPLVKTFHWSPRLKSLSIETIPVLCDWKRMVKQALESVHFTSISSSSTLPTWLTGTKSKSNTVQLRMMWSQTTWENL